jgi:hypothetical protein
VTASLMNALYPTYELPGIADAMASLYWSYEYWFYESSLTQRWQK